MKAFSGVERMSLLSGSASSGGEEPGFAEVVFLSSSPLGTTSLTVFLRHGQLDLSNTKQRMKSRSFQQAVRVQRAPRLLILTP